MHCIVWARGRMAVSLFFLMLFSCRLMAQGADPVDESTASGSVVEAEKEKDPDRGRFLALPFFITEPAIGEGLGGAVMYFHGKRDRDEPSISTADDIGKTDRKNKPPTTATGLFAFGTNNDTVGAGIAHRRTFKNDLYRFSAVAAYADVHTTFYVRDFPFDFTLEGSFLFSNLKRRIVGSNFFVGLSASYMDATVDFDFRPGDQENPGILDFPFTDAGLAGSIIYDRRDESNSVFVIFPSRSMSMRPNIRVALSTTSFRVRSPSSSRSSSLAWPRMNPPIADRTVLRPPSSDSVSLSSSFLS